MGAPLSRATFQGSLELRGAAAEVPVAPKAVWQLFKADVLQHSEILQGQRMAERMREAMREAVRGHPMRC